MRIRIAIVSWILEKNYRAAVRAVRTIQYNNLLFYLLFIISYRVRQKERPNLGGSLLRVGSAYSGGERVVEQRCTCHFQCTPW